MLELLTAPTAMRDAPDSNRPDPVLERLLRLRHENWARWVQEHWPEVRIADGVWSFQPLAGTPRLNAEACVTLGTLQPADVRVELLPGEPLPAGHPLQGGRPMFPVSALQNGRFRFAVNAPAHADDPARRWIVRVRPVRLLATVGDVAPVDGELREVPAETRRAGNRFGSRHERAQIAREVGA
jgi:hypothetical protein